MKTLSAIVVISILISLTIVKIVLTIIQPIELPNNSKTQIAAVLIIGILVSVFIGYLFFYIGSLDDTKDDNKSDKVDNVNKSDEDFLMYEVSGSWWTGFIFSEFLSNISAKYYFWKHERKYRRYLEFKKKINVIDKSKGTF